MEKQRPSPMAEQRCVYRLCKIIDGGLSLFASEEDTDLLAGFLTPEQVEAISSPALSLSDLLSDDQPESPSAPEPAPAKPANTYQKPGGPCCHCGALGARTLPHQGT